MFILFWSRRKNVVSFFVTTVPIQWERERERERERQTDRQTDRYCERERERHPGRN